MDIQYLKGVGPAVAKKLEKLNLTKTKDVLKFFPTSYQDRRNMSRVIDLELGKDEFLVVVIRSIRNIKKGRFTITSAQVSDSTGEIKCVWFNQAFIIKILSPNKRVFIHAKVEADKVPGTRVLKVSDYELVENNNIDRIMPIYPLTRGIYQKQLRGIVGRALIKELKDLVDPFPEILSSKYKLIRLKDAIFNYHYPKDNKIFLKAKRRLIFEDFLYLQLSLALQRKKVKSKEKGIQLFYKNTLSTQYFNSLPYQLTDAQERVIGEVREDMQKDVPMNRMVQGDVGAGKTEVAMAAILVALENDYQVAIMAPTEILAYQHYQKMLKYLLPLGIRIELLVGSLTKKNKERKYYLIESGTAQVIVGTHAVIQEKVKFGNLGLAIIDEQHRFGVMQRSALLKKSGVIIDLLVITATPIPRTLTLTLYGDLDKSILDEMPPGRTPIKTEWLKSLTKEYLSFIKSELDKKNQAYWVFPLVEESEKIDLKAATEGSEIIKKEIFPDYNIGLLHGKMKQKEKDSIMKQFREKKIDILVATTVIEVGVDVPDATVMVIEHAERFGLSQLHQLRGRIGRSDKPSCCILLSQSRSANSKKRLGALVRTTNGFELAEVDLELRGPGDYFGSKQSGVPTMFVANLIKDEPLLLESKKMAQEIADHIEKEENLLIFKELKKKPHLYVGNEGMN